MEQPVFFSSQVLPLFWVTPLYIWRALSYICFNDLYFHFLYFLDSLDSHSWLYFRNCLLEKLFHLWSLKLHLLTSHFFSKSALRPLEPSCCWYSTFWLVCYVSSIYLPFLLLTPASSQFHSWCVGASCLLTCLAASCSSLPTSPCICRPI